MPPWHRAAVSIGLAVAMLIHGGGAAAKDLPSRPGPARTPAAVITVINDRRVTLTRVEIWSAGDKPQRVARLGTHLASRERTKINLSPPRGCHYVVQADFADGSERRYEDFDFCLDGTVRFFD
jgi:hypothetical protein